MVTCKCCKFKYPETENMCTECGMTRLSGADVTDKQISEITAKIKKSYLENTKIYFVKYSYEISDNGISECDPITILLAEPIKMTVGEPEWFAGEFKSIPTEREIQIDIIIERTEKGIRKKLSVSLQPRKKSSFTKIGIVMTPGFRFRIVAGNNESYIESEEISIIKGQSV